MACDNTIQVLKGSTLTFESEVQICNAITGLDNLQFTDTLQKGLKVVNDSATASIDGGTSTITVIETITSDPDTNIDTLTVDIPLVTIATADYPVTVKVQFKATVDNLDVLLENPDDPTNAGKLTNTGTFTALNANGAPIGKAATVTLADTNVEEYSPEVSGYSTTVCPSDTDVLKAKFCLNTICGNFENGQFGNGQYVLTITAPDGISFYQDTIAAEPPVDVEAYTGCCCKSTKIVMSEDSVVFSPDYKTVTITIEDDEVDTALQSDTSDLCNHNISVYIPYKFADDYVYNCADSTNPLLITGSMIFNTGDDTPTLAELKNFGLYVNVDCGNLIGISKTILC